MHLDVSEAENYSPWTNGGVPGGKIHGVWPRSGSHVAHVRREPRGEDYEYMYQSKSGNRFCILWQWMEERPKCRYDGISKTSREG